MFLEIIFCIANTEEKTQFIICYNNDKCFLVLIVYINFVMFYFFYFFQKAGNNRFLKNLVAQNFVILFFGFCIK